jgi:hypothetical protein
MVDTLSYHLSTLRANLDALRFHWLDSERELFVMVAPPESAFHWGITMMGNIELNRIQPFLKTVK